MNELIEEHRHITRRALLKLAGQSSLLLASGSTLAAPASQPATRPALSFDELIRRTEAMRYLTPQALFGTVERGKPLPYTLPEKQLIAAGLTRESWKLEIVSDKKFPAKLRDERTRAKGNALTFDDLIGFAKEHKVRFLKTLTCANGKHPMGTGLWEGVPARLLIREASIKSHCRRVFYTGFHHNDPKQEFRSSLSPDRIFEDPYGMPPVILAYKLNGEWLSGKRGGPVRMIVPEAYGFKNIKWLNKITLSNRYTSNDTYSKYNNTSESWMKTIARFVATPQPVGAGEAFPLSGIAQSGTAGLRGVQYLIKRGLPESFHKDRRFKDDKWIDAKLLGAPTQWGTDADNHPKGSADLPAAFGFTKTQDAPTTWPIRFATAHWVAWAKGLSAGDYTIFCRSIDRNLRPQPWPRIHQNNGMNRLHKVGLRVL